MAGSNGSAPAVDAQEFIGSVDCGTTSCRFLIFDSVGHVVAQSQLEYKQIYPDQGWHEHDPHAYETAIDACIQGALDDFLALGHPKSSLKGVGITNQRETTICWDRHTGQPLYNAVVWPDTRNTSTVTDFQHKAKDVFFSTYNGPVRGEDGIRALTGLPISTYFAATKIAWLVENIPMVKAAKDDGSLMVGTVDSWLVYNYTGGVDGGIHVTDLTNASRTLLFSLHSLTWDPQLLSFFDVPLSALPTLVSNSEIYGHFKPGHPLAGVPICGLVGDQQAALVGNLCLEKGNKKQTYGTGCFMLYNTGPYIIKSTHGLLSTVGYKAGPKAQVMYALEGSVAVGGSSINWLRDNLGLISHPREAGELAEQVKDTGGVYFVTGFSGLFAPYWDQTATGMLIGLSAYTTKHHIARATLEAICFQTRAILEAMSKDAGFSFNTSTTASPSPMLHHTKFHFSATSTPIESVADHIHEDQLVTQLEKNLRRTRLMGRGERFFESKDVLKVDGGMTSSDVLCQMQADILGIPVERPTMRESTALGAALLAGAALDLFGWNLSDPSSFSKVNKAGVKLFEPSLKSEEKEWKYAGWNRAIKRPSGWKTDSGNG